MFNISCHFDFKMHHYHIQKISYNENIPKRAFEFTKNAKKLSKNERIKIDQFPFRIVASN